MPLSVEQICDTIAERRLLPSAEVSRLRARWFKPSRADANDLEKFGQWLSVNEFLTPFAFRMLRDWKADLLQLNQYQLTDHLVSGPFAGAYLALDPLRRPVVLEVLAADRANDPEAVRAFQIAAEKARGVRQANVNLTLDFGEAKGWHYLVRESDEGETLAEILARRGRLPPISAARLFALALLGLHALHESQVPAGPLGPESLLLTGAGKTAGKARTVKILNAGVPRSLFDPGAFDAVTTATAALDPTDAATISDPREDLFRLGTSFYRSLSGQLPFPTESAAASGHRATPIRQLAPEVPELLAQDVESMIDPNAAQRPASAARQPRPCGFFSPVRKKRSLAIRKNISFPIHTHRPQRLRWKRRPTNPPPKNRGPREEK
jgi:serine/threonine protein kinase